MEMVGQCLLPLAKLPKQVLLEKGRQSSLASMAKPVREL
jgi:hypothetical protein